MAECGSHRDRGMNNEVLGEVFQPQAHGLVRGNSASMGS